MTPRPAGKTWRFGQALRLVVALGLTLAPGLSPADTPRNDLHWAGPYLGFLPCADCAGIVTLLELVPDGHYRLSELYAGRSDKPVTSHGDLQWDAAGSVITLEGTDPPRRYKIGAGRAWALDLHGQVIEGALADRYILGKAE